MKLKLYTETDYFLPFKLVDIIITECDIYGAGKEVDSE
jgi:hypothetical protein